MLTNFLNKISFNTQFYTFYCTCIFLLLLYSFVVLFTEKPFSGVFNKVLMLILILILMNTAV